MVIYTVLVHTADTPGAGTDANVFISLIGDPGRRSQEFRLHNPDHADFEPGASDVFNLVDAPPDLGPLTAIALRCEGASRWALVDVAVRQRTPAIGPWTTFPVGGVLEAGATAVLVEAADALAA
jgi:hypothetical protein